MKALSFSVFLLLCIRMTLTAQSAEEVLQHYRQRLDQLQTISYQVRQLDTFLTGDVWDLSGQVTLQKAPDDKFFGFYFMATKKDLNRSTLYDGSTAFEINHTARTYELEKRLGEHLLGSPGGQLVVADMLYFRDTIIPDVKLIDGQYVLIFHYPDLPAYQVSERRKLVYLDPKTWLPAKVVKSQISLGKKQVMSRMITQVEVNQDAHPAQLDKQFLTQYEPEIRQVRKDPWKDLLMTPVEAFELEQFNGTVYALAGRAGKVILLDFWDVWCGPCRESMPKVQKFHEQFGAQGLEVVSVLMDRRNRESAQALFQHQGFTFLQAFSNEGLDAYFHVTAIPQYVLIDHTGLIRHIYRGFDESIEENIQELLEISR